VNNHEFNFDLIKKYEENIRADGKQCHVINLFSSNQSPVGKGVHWNPSDMMKNRISSKYTVLWRGGHRQGKDSGNKVPTKDPGAARENLSIADV